MSKSKQIPLKILIYEVGTELYYYDGEKLTKRIMKSTAKGQDVAMNEQDYELMKKIPYKKIYKEKRTPLDRPERSKEIILPGCGLDY